MKEFITSTKVKLVLGSVVFVAVFSFGAYARPGIDLTVDFLAGVTGSNKSKISYIAKKSDYEVSIDERMKRESNQKLYRAIAEMEVANEIAQKSVKRFDELSPLLNSKMAMLNGGISEETVNALVRIEKEQGRR